MTYQWYNITLIWALSHSNAVGHISPSAWVPNAKTLLASVFFINAEIREIWTGSIEIQSVHSVTGRAKVTGRTLFSTRRTVKCPWPAKIQLSKIFLKIPRTIYPAREQIIYFPIKIGKNPLFCHEYLKSHEWRGKNEFETIIHFTTTHYMNHKAYSMIGTVNKLFKKSDSTTFLPVV